MEQKKVKAVWWNDPTKTREFTAVAFEYVKSDRGWILSQDQQGVGVEKKVVTPVVAHAALANHNAVELAKAQQNYKDVTGQDAPMEWAEPKLFIETEKAKKQKAANPVPVLTDELNPEPEIERQEPNKEPGEYNQEEKPAPKKRGPKPKAATV